MGRMRSSGNAVADRTLDVLMLFSAGHSSLTIAEAAGELGMPRSTVYRYLQSLRAYCLVEEESGRYRLGPRILELAQAAWAGSGICEIALPTMRELSAGIGETVMLARLSGGSAVCIERLESKRPIRISMERGAILPWNASGAKVLCAALTDAEVRTLLERRPLKRYTDRTITDPDSFAEELRRVSHSGHAINDGEVDEGSWGLAAPVRDGTGCVVAALSVSVPRYRLDEQKIGHMIQDVCAGARQIGERLIHDE